MATQAERDAKKKLVLDKWKEWEDAAKAEGKEPNMVKFEQTSKGTNWETNVSSLRNWTGKNTKATGKTKTKTVATPTPTTIEDMEAAIKQQQEALAQQKKDYVKLLRSEVTRLKAELGKATQKYEEITEGMSQAELDELHDEEELKVSDAATDPANQN